MVGSSCNLVYGLSGTLLSLLVLGLAPESALS